LKFSPRGTYLSTWERPGMILTYLTLGTN